jgi:hypothetical protein
MSFHNFNFITIIKTLKATYDAENRDVFGAKQAEIFKETSLLIDLKSIKVPL